MPRLLTTMPMGGTAGATFQITITGESLDGASELRFSDPRITAEPMLDEKGTVIANKYLVKIADDCPVGLVEARVLTRLGLSSPRMFSVSTLPEVTQTDASTTLEAAVPLDLNSICNASMPARAINHYRFECDKGQRVIVDCGAKGIDSKLNAVLIIADEQGRDLVVQRRGRRDRFHGAGKRHLRHQGPRVDLQRWTGILLSPESSNGAARRNSCEQSEHRSGQLLFLAAARSSRRSAGGRGGAQ